MRNQIIFAQLKSELKRELLFSAESKDHPSLKRIRVRWSQAPICFPLISAFIYFDVGFGQGSIPDVFSKKLANSDPSDLPSYRLFIQEVEQRAKPSLKITILNFSWPEATQNWVILTGGQISGTIGNFPRDPGLLSNYAGALFVANNRE